MSSKLRYAGILQDERTVSMHYLSIVLNGKLSIVVFAAAVCVHVHVLFKDYL